MIDAHIRTSLVRAHFYMLPFTNHFYVEELNKELGERAFKQKVFSVAKCESNDDVLFLINKTIIESII